MHKNAKTSRTATCIGLGDLDFREVAQVRRRLGDLVLTKNWDSLKTWNHRHAAYALRVLFSRPEYNNIKMFQSLQGKVAETSLCYAALFHGRWQWVKKHPCHIPVQQEVCRREKGRFITSIARDTPTALWYYQVCVTQSVPITKSMYNWFCKDPLFLESLHRVQVADMYPLIAYLPMSFWHSYFESNVYLGSNFLVNMAQSPLSIAQQQRLVNAIPMSNVLPNLRSDSVVPVCLALSRLPNSSQQYHVPEVWLFPAILNVQKNTLAVRISKRLQGLSFHELTAVLSIFKETVVLTEVPKS